MAANTHPFEISEQAQKIVDIEGTVFKAKVRHQLNLLTDYRHNHGLSFEKLHAQNGLCSIRLNRECRLIINKNGNQLRLETILLHHEYDRLKRLSVFSGCERSETVSDELTFIGESFSQCSDMQRVVLDKPRFENVEMILGLPGTGKSILLCRVIAERMNPDTRVLYLCPKHLIKPTQRLFQLQGVGENVVVTDYANYMGLDDSFDEMTDLINWLERARKIHGNIIVPYLPDALAQEFELISAIGADTYLEHSTTQSCYPRDIRTFVLELFQTYMGEDHSRKNIRLSEISPASQITPSVHMIAIDEFQSLGPKQFSNLFRSFESFENPSQIKIFVAGDENQNLFTASSQLPFLRKLIQDRGMSLFETRLNQGFRCPPKVEIMADKLLSIRRECFGELHRSGKSGYEPHALENPALQLENCISHVSMVEFVPQPPDDFYGKLQYVVITDDDFLDDARKYFAQDTLIISYNQALGVEFNHVILWRPFSHNVFKEINKKLRNNEPHVGRGITADEVSAHTEVQKVFTAMLRTKQQLVIFEPTQLRHLYLALGLSSGLALSIDVEPQVSEREVKVRIKELLVSGALDEQTLKYMSAETFNIEDSHSATTTPLLPAIEPKCDIVLADEDQNMLERLCQRVKADHSILSTVFQFCAKKQNAEDCLRFLLHNSQTNLFQFIMDNKPLIMDNKPLIQKLIKILINHTNLFLTELHTKFDFSLDEWQSFQEFRSAWITEKKCVKDIPLVHQLMNSRNWNDLLDSYYGFGGDINLKSPEKNNTVMHDKKNLEQSKVSKILKLGGDVNALNCEGMTPFHVVITSNISSYEKIRLVNNFLNYGQPKLDATLNIKDSVLGYAISRNQVEIVKLLVEKDATCIGFYDKEKLSFLTHAIFENCHIDIILYLLHAGFEPNGVNHNDITNFSSAITLDRLDIVDALLKQPTIDPNFGDKFVPLTIAIMHLRSQKVPIIKRLLMHPRIEIDRITEGLRSFTPLGFLVRDDESTELARLLLTNDANPNIPGGSRNSFPLHDAIMCRNPDMVKLLLENRACPNKLDREGNNALHLAVKIKNPQIIQHVLSSGVDVNHTNQRDQTPLFFAIEDGESNIVKMICKTDRVNFNILFGPGQYSYLSSTICEFRNLDILKHLLDYGADPNLLHVENVSPLNFAAQENLDTFVDLLLKKGANPHLATSDNITPLMIASKHHNGSKLINSLLAYKADVNTKRLSNSTTPLMLAIQNEAIMVVETLLKAKANLNETSLNGACPISFAVRRKNVGILDLLVKYGIDLNQIIYEGFTPLMYSINLECLSIVSRILENDDVDVNALSPRGASALSFACKSGHTSLVSALLDKRGDPNLAIGKNNPLCIAVSSANTTIAQILLSKGAQANPTCESSPLVLAMGSKQDEMTTLLLKNGAASGVSLTGPNSIWIPAIKSGHPPNLRQLQNTLGGSFDAIVVDDKTHLSLAIDFRCKEIIHWLLTQPRVVASPEQIELIGIWEELILIDKIIEEAKSLYEKLSPDPRTKDLEKKIDFNEICDRLKELHSKYTQCSKSHGLVYLENLVIQLHSFLVRIQAILESHFQSDSSRRLSP